MTPNDLPPGTPGWIVLGAFVIVGLNFLFRFLSQMSESAAKFLGPLGRRWRKAGLRRQEMRAAENTYRLESIENERDYFRTLAYHNASEKGNVEKHLEEFLAWYQRCDQPFHRDLRIRAAESGCELPPDWKPLSEWGHELPKPDQPVNEVEPT